MGKLRGLLGNFDGNASNDFIFPNGTMLPVNSSDRQLHYYGQSCKCVTFMYLGCIAWIAAVYIVADHELVTFSGHIILNESLFTYPEGLTAANFTYPDHMPVFMDELSESTIAEARGVCGNNTQCIYDLTQTGNVELAMTTLAVNEENLKEETLAGMY